MALARMRTITQAYEYLKKQDPETALSKTAFRTFVNEGYIPVVIVGTKKKLVNLDNVDRFLEEGMDIKEVPKVVGIRRIG